MTRRRRDHSRQPRARARASRRRSWRSPPIAATCVIFGHTHRAIVVRDAQGRIGMNPGAAGPRALRSDAERRAADDHRGRGEGRRPRPRSRSSRWRELDRDGAIEVDLQARSVLDASPWPRPRSRAFCSRGSRVSILQHLVEIELEQRDARSLDVRAARSDHRAGRLDHQQHARAGQRRLDHPDLGSGVGRAEGADEVRLGDVDLQHRVAARRRGTARR